MKNQSPFGFVRLDVAIACLVAVMTVTTFFPRYAASPDQQRLATAEFDLARLRCVVESYRADHGGVLPKPAPQTGTMECLLARTDRDGRLTDRGVCGPYLKSIPVNPLTDSRQFRLTDRTELTPDEITPHNRGGWLYNERTGQVWLDSEPGWQF